MVKIPNTIKSEIYKDSFIAENVSVIVDNRVVGAGTVIIKV